MRYHVVLQGPRSSELGAAHALAEAIAARYGVPAEAISQRLAAGGFQVKSNVDLDTAMSYAVDLTKLGGACLVVDAATGEPVQAQKTDEPVGLAAASGDIPIALGALAGGDIVVSTLDGEVDQPAPSHTESAFSAPGVGDGDAAAPAAAPAAARQDLEFLDDGEDELLTLDASPYTPQPVADPAPAGDAFAPPSSDVSDDELMLAEDPRMVHTERDESRAPVALPPPTQTAAPRTARPRGPSLGEQLGNAMADARLSMARRGRFHFLAGAVLAVLIGFVIAHVVASIQETDAYPPLTKELKEAYAEAVDPNTYATLPEVRDGLQILVNSRQRRIAITSGLLWLAAAGAFAFLWFRKIRWEALEPPRPPAPAVEPDPQAPAA